MKGLLVLQRRFAYVGHELAVLLKESHGITEFCGFVHEREGFDYLRSQKDVPYTGLILDEEIQKRHENERLDMDFLREFEREYGNLWQFISIDRVIRYGQLVREYPFDTPSYSYEEMLRIVQVYGKQLLAFVEEQKPDFVFAYQPGAMGTMILLAIARKKRIPIIYTIPSITENLAVLSERYDRLTWVDALFSAYQKKNLRSIEGYEEAVSFVERFRKQPVIYSTVYNSLIKHGKWKQFDFLHPKHFYRTYSYIRLVFRKWQKNKEVQTDYTSVRPSDYFYDRIRRKVRTLWGVDDLYDTFDRRVPYVFYALHFEPELSLLLLSPFDMHQLDIIWRLARSLPVGMYLYVKEHPQMAPYRARRFYTELKKIPNVRLLRPEISGFEIMRKATLVSTITGAVGWEATLLGKAVITFGDVFYNALPSAKRSRTPEELPKLVEEQLALSPRDEDLIRFVAALFTESAKCDLLHLWEFETDPIKKREGLKGLAQLLAQKVHLVTHK